MKRTPLFVALFLITGLCACGAPTIPESSDATSSSHEHIAPEESSSEVDAPPDLPEISEPPRIPEDDTFVRVIDYIPTVSVDLKYATEDNFTGSVIYDFSDAYLRYGTVRKLADAAALAAQDGYRLLIWDAFRPTAAQFKLWDICPDPVYVANPNKGFSSHSRGNTLDLTLICEDGSPVEMPTGFDDFSSLADRDYSDVPELAAENARYLEDLMERCGFQGYSGEWWHFSDTDRYDVDEAFSPAS